VALTTVTLVNKTEMRTTEIRHVHLLSMALSFRNNLFRLLCMPRLIFCARIGQNMAGIGATYHIFWLYKFIRLACGSQGQMAQIRHHFSSL